MANEGDDGTRDRHPGEVTIGTQPVNLTERNVKYKTSSGENFQVVVLGPDDGRILDKC